MPTAAAAIRVRAHAKINLNLRVLGCRPDGYHDLRTVFQALALHDTLTFTRRPGPFVIECSDPRLPRDATNLVWRAADLLRARLGGQDRLADVVVQVEKRIPMKAGLGGGSADAAAALAGLARLWNMDLDAREVAMLARQLGADVAFFLTGGAALGLGRGDDIRPLSDLSPLGVLLVVPAFDVSTADAYRWWDEQSARVGQSAHVRETRNAGRTGRVGEKADDVSEADRGFAPRVQAIPRCPWPGPDSQVVNDFEPVVSARHPVVRELVGALLAAGASAAAMTGSGSTVFGLFEEDDRLSHAARTLVDGGHAVIVTRTLARHEYAAESAPACL